MIQNDSAVRVAILGLGYVGCVSAACFAEMGYHVVGIERDQKKVQDVLQGQAPFYEPGLEALIQSNVATGRLTATRDTDALSDADVVIVCVGTPSEKNGDIGLEQLRRVVESIAATLSGRTKPLVVAIRSTVFPGTCENVVMPIFDGHANVTVVANPEFLREGTAVRDFMEPSLVVVGGSDAAAVDMVASLYAQLPKPACKVSLRTAEMIKYACNAFHATKVAFANEIGALSAHLEVDPTEVMATLCEDKKLNVSPAYLKPGLAFGGSCLAKDLRALSYRARQLDLQMPLLGSVIPSNDRHLDRALDAILDLPGRHLGFIGLAFKEDTDDLRESRVVAMLESLIGKGRNVRIFDPHIQIDTIYGSNRSFVLREIPHIERLIDNSVEDTLHWADHLIVTQKMGAELKSKVIASGLPLVDLAAPSLSYLRHGSPVLA